MTKIEQLKAAYEAAAQGELEAIGARVGSERAGIVAETFGLKPYEASNFIALAHNLMPALLEAVEALQAVKNTLSHEPLPWDRINAALEKLK